jgi:hypothetical protein
VARLADRLARSRGQPDADPSAGPVVARRRRVRRRPARARSSGLPARQSWRARRSGTSLASARARFPRRPAPARAPRGPDCAHDQDRADLPGEHAKKGQQPRLARAVQPFLEDHLDLIPRAPSTRSSVSRARRAGEHSTSSGRTLSARRSSAIALAARLPAPRAAGRGRRATDPSCATWHDAANTRASSHPPTADGACQVRSPRRTTGRRPTPTRCFAVALPASYCRPVLRLLARSGATQRPRRRGLDALVPVVPANAIARGRCVPHHLLDYAHPRPLLGRLRLDLDAMPDLQLLGFTSDSPHTG